MVGLGRSWVPGPAHCCGLSSRCRNAALSVSSLFAVLQRQTLDEAEQDKRRSMKTVQGKGAGLSPVCSACEEAMVTLVSVVRAAAERGAVQEGASEPEGGERAAREGADAGNTQSPGT